MSDLAAAPQWLGSAESLFLLLGRGHTGFKQNFGAETALRELGFVELSNRSIAPYIPPIAPVLEELGIGGSTLATLRNICSVGAKGQLLSPSRSIINLVCLVTARQYGLAEMTPERFAEIIKSGRRGILPPWLNPNPNVISANPQVIQAALPFLEAELVTFEGSTLVVRHVQPQDANSAFQITSGEAFLAVGVHSSQAPHALLTCKSADYHTSTITTQDGNRESMDNCRKILAIDGEWV